MSKIFIVFIFLNCAVDLFKILAEHFNFIIPANQMFVHLYDFMMDNIMFML